MKKWLALIIMTVMTVSLCLTAASAETTIVPDENLKVKAPSFLENNPVIEGEDPMTGLPLVDKNYTPILLVFDNTKEGYPHWGVKEASIILQIPNQDEDNNKLLGLYTSEYPHMAGGSRSARMTMLPFANVFNSAFVSAYVAPTEVPAVSVEYWRVLWKIYNSNYDVKELRKYYNLLGNGTWKERVSKSLVQGSTSANLVAHIDEIHQELIENGVAFEKRPFLFTDEPLTRGEEATVIGVKFFEDKEHEGKSNAASNCTFYYDEGIGYTREAAAGIDTDRLSNETLVYSNVIVMRVSVQHTAGYSYYEDNLVGGGQADIFQSGRYIKGTWYRDDVYGRLIFMDENGEELKLQRGKTYIVVNNNRAQVTFE